MLPTFFFFYYGYDQTHYCYPGILLCGNEENQFHFPKEEVKCLRSGSCSFIRGVLNVLKWEGQEIEWRFCISELPRDTLRVTEVPRSGERDWVCINSHYYGCIRLKNKQCNNQNVWCGPKTLCLYLIWNPRNMTPRTNCCACDTSCDKGHVLYSPENCCLVEGDMCPQSWSAAFRKCNSLVH